MGALLAVGGLLAVPGCGDDTTATTTAATGTGATTGTGTTTTTGTTTSSGTGGAGGDGGSAAVPTCENYCADIQTNCVGANQQYSDQTNCMAVCVAFQIGEGGALDGNSLGCREYHAGIPATMDAALHCPHAGPLGGGVCGADPCEAFCQIGTTVCEAVATGWATEAECRADCAIFPGIAAVPYTIEETIGDSLACRMYHLQVASLDQANHCPHISNEVPPAAFPCKN